MLDVLDGVIRPDPGKDVAMTAMIDRLGKGSGMSVAFIKGFRLTAGAIASTHNAVCENLAIVGPNGADMAFAAQELQRMRGGQIVVRDGKILAAFRMPILGLFSDQSYEEVLERRREIQVAAESLGCTLNDPLLKLEFNYACAEFPLLRMSEEGGLFRTDTPLSHEATRNRQRAQNFDPAARRPRSDAGSQRTKPAMASMTAQTEAVSCISKP
jgi:adenine deaminase